MFDESKSRDDIRLEKDPCNARDDDGSNFQALGVWKKNYDDLIIIKLWPLCKTVHVLPFIGWRRRAPRLLVLYVTALFCLALLCCITKTGGKHFKLRFGLRWGAPKLTKRDLKLNGIEWGSIVVLLLAATVRENSQKKYSHM